MNFRILLSFLLVATALAQKPAVEDPEYLPRTVIVKLAPSNRAVGEPRLNAELDRLGLQSNKPFLLPLSSTAQRFTNAEQRADVFFWEEEVSRIVVVEYASDVSPRIVAAQLSLLPEVEYAEPYYLNRPLGGALTPDDSLFSQQAFLKTIMAEQAWDITQGSESIIIGIADTDVKWDHPDLEANIWINPGESGVDGLGRDKRTNGVDDDGNGMVDDWHGWDFAGVDNNSPDNDTRTVGQGHGTAVAGLAGAVTNNRIGIASIGNKCKILPMKIGADGGGGLSFGYQAMDYASRMGARVFNASWGSFGYSQSALDVINLARSRGMLIVGGAGNHGSIAPFYPASYPGVLSAGVTTAQDVITGASAYGPPVDVMSPGEGALTTNVSGGYSGFVATSAAAPIVSGLAGLVTTHFPSYSTDQIAQRIRVTCDNIDAKNPTRARFAGKGRINAYRALSDPDGPSLRITTFSIQDPNNDERLEPGEEIDLVVTLRNYLSSTSGPVNLTLVPVTNTQNVQITNASVSLSSIGSGATMDNAAQPFRFLVRQSSNYDARVLFRVDITSGSYDDFDFISVSVNPSYADMLSGQLLLTIQANGMLGFKDYPDNTQGEGMKLGTTDLQLYLGSAMLGTDQTHIVDNARGTGAQDFLVRLDDLRNMAPVRVEQSVAGARARATSKFTDAGADSTRRLNVEVLHEVFDFSNRGVTEVLFSKYSVKNIGTTALMNLRFGLFMDFGGYPSFYNATVAYDSSRHFGYVVKGGFPTVGTFVIDTLPPLDAGRSSFWAINNDHRVPGNPFGTLDGFTFAERWRALSSYERNPTCPVGNVAYVISAPTAASINPGDSATFVFGHHAGTNVLTMGNVVAQAVNFWRNLGTVSIERIPGEIVSGIDQIYPNPIADGAAAFNVNYFVAGTETVTMELFASNGLLIKDCGSRTVSRGYHHMSISLAALPPGVYFLRMRTSTSVYQKPVVVLQSPLNR